MFGKPMTKYPTDIVGWCRLIYKELVAIRILLENNKATVAPTVEHEVSNLGVGGSNPPSRST